MPGRLGMEFLSVEADEVRARMRVEQGICAWNGFLHAGAVVCVARPMHKGRTTQVWDAEVRAEKTGRTIAHFRCTQMILQSRS